MTERERQLTITLRFTTFGTEDQGRNTGERLRRMLALELGRPVALLALEVDGDDARGAEADSSEVDQQSGDGGDHGGPSAASRDVVDPSSGS